MAAAALPDELAGRASVVLAAAEIEGIVERMAAAVSRDLAGRNPIIMPILIGGAFAAVRLSAHLNFPYEVDSLRVARYGKQFEGGRLHWHARPCLDLTGRDVLVVDDVLDRGVTLTAVEHELRRMNAASVSTAVLIRKQHDPAIERPAVDYVGADAPDRFLFGCGMDYEGSWRGLPALYALDPPVGPATL